MTIYIAFYKGKVRKDDPLKTKLKHISDWIIRFITHSPYSHCEVAIPSVKRENVYHCYSASIRDHGVRDKWMFMPDDRWDFVGVEADEASIEAFFNETKGLKYDWFGVFRFLVPLLKQSTNKWFCSEWCAQALGIEEPWRYTPQKLFELIKQRA